MTMTAAMTCVTKTSAAALKSAAEMTPMMTSAARYSNIQTC